MAKTPFRIIVVGGSIAGLTLAHCLDQAGVDYVVLEKHGTIDSAPLGGFIAIMPTGARILTQLGLYAAVSRAGKPITVIHTGYPDGFEFSDYWPTFMAKRLGFPLSVLRRQELLSILYTSLKDQSKIHVKKGVAKITQTDTGVSIITHDGSVYYGDIAVGADGIHSVTRLQALQITNPKQPGVSMTWSLAFASRFLSYGGTERGVEYSGVVGISNEVVGIRPGEQITRMYDGLTIFIFGGKGTLIGWLVVQRLGRRYKYPNTPRFSQNDAINACTQLLDYPVRRHVNFGDVWAQRESFTMVSLEEGFLPYWHNGRVVCIGDSVSKMTPNIAQGANSAIEHAAALANALHRLVTSQSSHTRPSNQEITSSFGALVEKRFWHMNIVNQSSWHMTRIHARQGRFLTFIGRHVVPYLGRLIVHILSWQFADGVALEYMPLQIGFTPPIEPSKKGTSMWVGSMILAIMVSLGLVALWRVP